MTSLLAISNFITNRSLLSQGFREEPKYVTRDTFAGAKHKLELRITNRESFSFRLKQSS